MRVEMRRRAPTRKVRNGVSYFAQRVNMDADKYMKMNVNADKRKNAFDRLSASKAEDRGSTLICSLFLNAENGGICPSVPVSSLRFRAKTGVRLADSRAHSPLLLCSASPFSFQRMLSFEQTAGFSRSLSFTYATLISIHRTAILYTPFFVL